MKMNMPNVYVYLNIILLNLVLNTGVLGTHHHQHQFSNSNISSTSGNSNNSSNESKENLVENKWPKENELEKRVKNVGWSGWSEWSTCSRSCDGGVAQQLRRCLSPHGCRGDPIRYKICNMQPCPEVQDFRAHQCSAYDEVPYDGALYKWVTHYDYSRPCALTCRGRPHHLQDDDDDTIENVESTGLDDEPSVIVQLSNRVQDGTRCRMGSLDMCIQGNCQRVGCDLKIGSAKKIDACGICGGDGSSCSQTLYQWETSPMSHCSVTCGGGYKMARPNCRNRITGTDVDESLCNAAGRPEPSVVQCNTHMCPAKWITDEWSPCSKSCGNGMRERAVVCAEESNGIKNKVPDEGCRTIKPVTIEPCNVQECPKWIAHEWSGCSVSCGSGLQVRKVDCIDGLGGVSTKCNGKTKPVATQQCETGISCVQDFNVRISNNDHDGPESIGDQPYSHYTKSLLHHEEKIPQSLLKGTNSTQDKQQQQLQKQQQRQLQKQSDQQFPTEPTYLLEPEWSECNVTCGDGYRARNYTCKIFLEFSQKLYTIDDHLCHGPKPKPQEEYCYVGPCALAYSSNGDFLDRDMYRSGSSGSSSSSSGSSSNNRDLIKVGVSEPGKTYVWREQGYTSCSASCLGGVEELIINCVREDTLKVSSPFLCSPETKPEARIRTCNDRPCPPRWNYSDFSPCTKSCGIGIREREVQCIHEVTRGGENTMVVPNNMCPQPPPAERQYCNVLDCPIRWETSAWSKCSKPCGGGVKERRVECKQIMAQEHKVERHQELCPGLKPIDVKTCNTKQCAPEEQSPPIQSSNTTFIQHEPVSSPITVKIGGAATVFYGIQVKIKCPVKRFNRTKIRWTKDQNVLVKNKHFKISKKGALRILNVNYKDSGVYGCHAGSSVAYLNLTIKPIPNNQVSLDEYKKYQAQLNSTRQFTRADSQQAGLPSSGNEDGGSSRNKQRDRNRGRNRQKDDSITSEGDIKNDENYLVENEELLNDDSPHTAASSSGTRPIVLPHLQHLVASLQSFSNSRGHRLLFEHNGYRNHKDMDQLVKDQPISGDNRDDDDDDDDDRDGIDGSTEFSQIKNSFFGLTSDDEDNIVLGQGSREDIKFEWMLTPWSVCSQSCGTTGGFRTRKIHCMVKLHNATQNVDSLLCEDAGLSIPQTIEKCGVTDCPKWVTTNWSLCIESRCLSRNTAVQKRNVFCKLGNDKLSNDCDVTEKPVSRQECYNERCKGTWKVEKWSECNAACGAQGLKYRILHCVWYGTRKPAGNACLEYPRPMVMKVCKGPPCISNFVDCKDTSRYCKNVKSMGLCKLHRYQQKCCRSCRLNFFYTSNINDINNSNDNYNYNDNSMNGNNNNYYSIIDHTENAIISKSNHREN